MLITDISLGNLRQLVSEAFTRAYDILGVSPHATPDEIRSAYRRLAVQLHPDRNRGTDTTADMARLNVAYGLLSDPLKRQHYDLSGDRTLAGSAAKRSRPQQPPKQQEPTPRADPQWTSSVPLRYFTFVGGTSRKFWWIERVRNIVKVGWGRIGTAGQTKDYTFPTPRDAAAFYYLRKKTDDFRRRMNCV